MNTEIDPSKTYPLSCTWVLSFKGKVGTKKQQSEDDWLKTYEKIYEIDSVNTLWSVFNNIYEWQQLHVGSIYALFKGDIDPSWEHPDNKEGCSYVLYLNQNSFNEESRMELFWNFICFMVGNETDYHDYLNGVTFERKYRGDRITLWCTAQSEDMIKIVLESIGMRPTDYTYSSTPLNDNYKVCIKMTDHKEELRKLSDPNPDGHHHHHNNHKRRSQNA